MGKSSPTVAIQSKFMRSNDYFIKFHMSRLLCQVETICGRLNFWQTFKISSWQNFLVCRDIKFLVATFSTLGGTSHPLVVKANISSMCYDVATTSFQGDLFLSRPNLYLFQISEQIAFNSLSNFKPPASKKSNSQKRNLNRVKNSSLFSLSPSCELLKLSRSCSSLHSLHFCTSTL